jgi:putative acetyltransferase
MPPEFTVRLAHASDLDAVHRIYMHAKVVPYLGYDPMPIAEFRPIFADLVASNTFHIVEFEGEVRAFYRVQRHYGRAHHVALLTTFAVDPTLHATGLARAIVERLIAQLPAQGVRRLELSAEADNTRAIAFYEKLGFQHEGRLRAAYRRATDAHDCDEVMMAKLLS